MCSRSPVSPSQSSSSPKSCRRSGRFSRSESPVLLFCLCSRNLRLHLLTQASLVSAVSPQYTQFSGIVGMGFASLAAYGINPVFDSVLKRRLLDVPQFSFYFSQSVSTGHQRKGCVFCVQILFVCLFVLS